MTAYFAFNAGFALHQWLQDRDNGEREPPWFYTVILLAALPVLGWALLRRLGTGR